MSSQEATFLSWAFAACASVSLLWLLLAAYSYSTSSSISVAGIEKLAPSEAVIFSLSFGGILLGVSHWLLHTYQSGKRGEYPSHLSPSVVVPPYPGRYRRLVFFFLVLIPALFYPWLTSRVFKKFEIERRGSGAGEVRRSHSALLRWPSAPEPNLFQGDWRWFYWADSKSKANVAISAYPGLQPGAFVLLSAGFLISAGVAMARRRRGTARTRAADPVAP